MTKVVEVGEGLETQRPPCPRGVSRLNSRSPSVFLTKPPSPTQAMNTIVPSRLTAVLQSPRLLCLFAVALAAPLSAQTAPPSVAASNQGEPVVISPFEVSTSKDTGYTASSTLAGTRMNTE